MSVVLLFGAGASVGAGGLNTIPPLGRDLYNQLATDFPNTWGKLPSNISPLFIPNFENGMNYVYNNQAALGADINLTILLRDMAIFFSRFQIVNFADNMYCRLFSRYLNAINDNRVIIASLNYDCLIELALNTTYPYKADIEPYPVIKVHGSCNFIPEFIFGDTKGFNLQYAKFNTPIKAVMPSGVPSSLDGIPLPPAMSLYMKGKKSPIAPNAVDNFIAKYQECVKLANVVIAIGVQPNLDDMHIWNALKDTSATLVLVANEKRCDDWSKTNRTDKTIVLANHFEDEFFAICRYMDLGLKSMYP
jgi:hypothetical protein